MPPWMGHYVVCPRAGDPICRLARARAIWAVNTAAATEALGMRTLLVGDAGGMPFKVETVDGLQACRRKLSHVYNVDADFDIFLTYAVPEAIPDNKKLQDGNWEASYEFPRYVLPRARVVHTRDPRIVTQCVKRKIPFIYEDHDEDYQPKDQLDALDLNGPFCRAAVAITAAVQNRLVAAGIDPDRILVLDSGVNGRSLGRHDERARRWRRFLLDEETPRLVVYSGGLQEERGLDHLIDAAEQLRHVRFVLLGGTPKDVERLLVEAGRRSLRNVKLLGFVEHQTVVELQQAADLLVLTRRADPRAQITSPLKFFEYLASGTPVVAARIAALDQAAYEGLAVRWYDPARPRELAGLIERALEQLPRREAGYAHNMAVARRFTWEERQRRLLDHAGLLAATAPPTLAAAA